MTTAERPAPRYGAASFPQIQGIRLVPPGAAATLVNLSATGILVECESRLLPGALLAVEFAGTFSPASVEGSVTRCEVIGIATNSLLRYRIGIAFSKKIVLPKETAGEPGKRAATTVVPAATPAVPPPATPVAPPAAPAAPAGGGAAPAPPVLRNRW